MKCILAAAVALVSSAVSAVSFADVTHWTGTGTNETVLVIDFNGSGEGDQAFAWGYRWNDYAPSVAQVVKRIAAADPRLTVEFGEGGGFISRCAYDHDDNPATPELEGILDMTDREDGDQVHSSGTLWALLMGTGSEFPVDGLAEPPLEAMGPYPENGQWICWRLCPFETTYQMPDWEIVEDFVDFTSTNLPVPAEPTPPASVSTFADVQTWVGEGAHETVLVIDFNDGSEARCAFAWGYRWDGDAPTVEEMMTDLAAADPRLTFSVEQGAWGGFLNQIAYDHDNNPYTSDLEGSVEDYDDEDNDYYLTTGTSWMLLAGDGIAYPRDSMETTDGMSIETVSDGGWLCWRICSYVMANSKTDWDDFYYEAYTTSFYDPVVAWPLPVIDPPPPESVFGFADVEAWVGTGANETVLVVDFNDGSVENCSFAWGYRWDGEAPSVEEMMAEIAAADPRLTFSVEQGSWGGFLNQIAYDHDDDPLTPDLTGCIEDYYDEDDDCYYYTGTSWMLLAGAGDTYPRNAMTETPNGMSGTFPTSGEWYCWRVCSYASTYAKPDGSFVDYFMEPMTTYDVVSAYEIPLESVASYADVQAWVGTGAHETVLVIDFNDGSEARCAFAWGYRWDGDAPTVEQMMADLAAADPRLTFSVEQGAWGGFLNQIAYDHDNNPYTPDLEGCVEEYSDQDEDFYYSNGTSWMLLAGDGIAYPRDSMETTDGMSIETVPDGGWLCWRVCTYATTYAKPNFDFVDYYMDSTSYNNPVAAWTFPVVELPPVDPSEPPTIAGISVTDDAVTVVPGNVVDGLYYGLAVAATPAGPFVPPTSWIRAENGSAVLTAPKSGDRAFFKVVVTATPAN